MEGIQRDIQHAIRNLLRHPGFLTIAVVTLALGIGGTTAIFSTVNALLVRPLNFPNLDRVVAIWENMPSKGVERNESRYVCWWWRCSRVSCQRGAQRKSIRWLP